jgi:glycosyltransferase involved in cell wall biosynthesis
MSLQPNAGKGAAVQAGMLAATGDYRLMVDADGATEFGSGLLALTIELNKNVSDTEGETSSTKPATATGGQNFLGSWHMDGNVVLVVLHKLKTSNNNEYSG